MVWDGTGACAYYDRKSIGGGLLGEPAERFGDFFVERKVAMVELGV